MGKASNKAGAAETPEAPGRAALSEEGLHARDRLQAAVAHGVTPTDQMSVDGAAAEEKRDTLGFPLQPLDEKYAAVLTRRALKWEKLKDRGVTEDPPSRGRGGRKIKRFVRKAGAPARRDWVGRGRVALTPLGGADVFTGHP